MGGPLMHSCSETLCVFCGKKTTPTKQSQITRTKTNISQTTPCDPFKSVKSVVIKSLKKPNHTFANNHPINPPASQTSVVLCALCVTFCKSNLANHQKLNPQNGRT